MSEPKPEPDVVPVAVVAMPAPPEATATRAQETAAAAKAQGQRDINKVWEYTQATIALAVVLTMLMVDAFVAVAPPAGLDQSALMQLNTMASLVIGFYFGRTNHQRSGGIGGDQVTGGR